MKQVFHIVMLLFVAAISTAVVFLLKPNLAQEANIISTPADSASIKDLGEPILAVAQPQKEVIEFPYATFDAKEAATLPGAASSSKKIVADLDGMKLYLYSGETLEKEIDIKSRGRVGTFWETPPGEYQINLKERNHFSSIGHVWMPYSMHFFGNYFIHGWPYYADGTEVGEGYSGGCIRLTTEDAEVVYNFAEKKTPLYVYGVQAKDQPQNSPATLATLPDISSPAYSIADVTTGTALKEKSEDTQIPLGGITHIMTALVSLEALNQYNEALISNIDTESNLIPSSRIEILDLLTYLIFKSDARAADTMAHYIGPKWFAENMNKKAKAIGMKHTSFADALGENDTNISTPNDMMTLLYYVYNNKVHLTKLSKTSAKETRFERLENDNPFIAYKNFEGGFVGKTETGLTNATLLFKTSSEPDAHLIAIVLTGSKDIEADVTAILTSLNK